MRREGRYRRFLGSLTSLASTLLVVLATATAGHAAEVSTGQTRLSEAELEVWTSPTFQKRFAESYLSVTEVEPTVTQSEREKMLDVLELISSDKLDEAARLLEKNTKEASSAVFDFTLANIYSQQEQLDSAVEVYGRAVAKFPNFRRAWKNMGLIHVRNGEFPRAVPALTRAIELGGGDALTYGLLGFAYGSTENNLAAESAYRAAILLDPETLDWKMGLARSLFKQERYADAVALCEGLIADAPDRADLWLLQANAYIGLNEPLKAAVNYELVDQMGKSTVDSLNMLADIYVNQELYEVAVNTYIRALEREPQRTLDRAVRAAKVLAARGAFEATRRLIRSLETARGDAMDAEKRKDLLKLQARIAVAEGAGQEEIQILEQIVELDPLDGEALILLGQHCAAAEDFEKAAFYFERAESLDKHEADAKVRHAQCLVQQRKYAEALPLLRRAQDLKPREDVQKYLEQVERVAKVR